MRSPIFAPLGNALARLPARRWPTHDELTAAASGLATSRGKSLRFVSPRGHTDRERRSPERDALTLFDEGGVIVASSSDGLSRLIPAFEWKDLFWHRRAEVEASMRFFAFGHGLYEQALAPYLGMVAKTVFIPAKKSILSPAGEADVAPVDALVAAHFADRARFPSPRSMAPMPVLGIPGWHPGTALESFYDDAQHFRSKGPR